MGVEQLDMRWPELGSVSSEGTDHATEYAALQIPEIIVRYIVRLA